MVRLLDFIHSRLLAGGVAFLGNFTPVHANKAFFDHALDWPLHLRSADELVDLVNRSRFCGNTTTVGHENEGVQLFVKCVKSS